MTTVSTFTLILSLYDESRIRAFQCDISKDDLSASIDEEVDIVSAVFVLSALTPKDFGNALENISKVNLFATVILATFMC